MSLNNPVNKALFPARGVEVALGGYALRFPGSIDVLLVNEVSDIQEMAWKSKVVLEISPSQKERLVFQVSFLRA